MGEAVAEDAIDVLVDPRLEVLALRSQVSCSGTVGSLHSLGVELDGLIGTAVVLECMSLGKLWYDRGGLGTL